jgi:hypothetical protein
MVITPLILSITPSHAKNGASGYLLARMILNVLIDTILGMIPFIGDIFDFAFKANIRNLKLMHQHYAEGRHRGSAWKIILPILIVLLAIVIGAIWVTYKLFAGIFN